MCAGWVRQGEFLDKGKIVCHCAVAPVLFCPSGFSPAVLKIVYSAHEEEAMNEQLVETAINCVKAGGTVLLSYYRKLQSLRIESKGRYDYVTEADFAAQEEIVNLIRDSHPGHDILAEEDERRPSQNANRWLVDPLDGTTNFIHGFPAFAVSVALEHKDSIVLGAVYDPCRDELFLARKGLGASLNGSPIRVSARSTLNEALVATAFPWRERSILSRYLDAFTQVFTKVSDIRRGGSAALDLCYVACGRCEGFWEAGLSPWDIAAGHLLVREAGGIISDFSGESNHIWVGDVVAGNPHVHGFLSGIILEVFGGNVSTRSM
jgi:myo-inositol-1(or 4)-monophosphatase